MGLNRVRRMRKEGGGAGAGAGAGDRIRVAFCIDNMNVGGTELNAVRAAERLDRSRFDLCVICLQEEGPLLERYAAAGVPVHAYPISSLYGPSTLRQGLRLARFLRARRVDILHSHDAYSNVFASPWGRAAGVRVITSRRWWEGSPGLAWRLANRVAYRTSHVGLANSPRIGGLLEREGVPSSRITVVPNFVDEDAFEPPSPGERAARLASMGLDLDRPVVGIVANLSPVKDHDTLLHAVALLRDRRPEPQLLLIGDGGRRTALEALAAELGISKRVFLAGRMENRPNLHHLFDISVLCSRSEGLSNSILEGMAAGRPVVATDVGASGDAVIDGETGLLVPSGRPDRMADALDTLLSDPGLARRMGDAGRRRAREHYSAGAALDALEDLYTRLAGRTPSFQKRRSSAADRTFVYKNS